MRQLQPCKFKFAWGYILCTAIFPFGKIILHWHRLKKHICFKKKASFQSRTQYLAVGSEAHPTELVQIPHHKIKQYYKNLTELRWQKGEKKSLNWSALNNGSRAFFQSGTSFIPRTFSPLAVNKCSSAILIPQAREFRTVAGITQICPAPPPSTSSHLAAALSPCCTLI